MPPRLKRVYGYNHLHFVTFSCYERRPYLAEGRMRNVFLESLEKMRVSYGVDIDSYVVMPEHVHLLLSEPKEKKLSVALQALKISVSRKSQRRPFWTPRYHDFNVFTEEKVVEKRQYIHQNPVERALVMDAGSWEWSSYLHWMTGVDGPVEVDSSWTSKRKFDERGGPLTSLETHIS